MDIENCFSKSVEEWKKLGNDKANLNFKGIYIPSGEHCTLSITYNSQTLQPVGHKWKFDESSVESSILSEVEIRMFEALNLQQTKSEILLNVVFFFVKCGEKSAPTHAEHSLPEFLYLFAVGIQDLEDEEDFTWLSFDKWESVRFLKRKERIYNAQDLHIVQVNLGTLGEDLLKSISEYNPFNRQLGMTKPGNGILFIPSDKFLFQRLENWVLISPKNYEKTSFDPSDLPFEEG